MNNFEILIDKEEAIALGKQRQNIHINNSSRRFFKDKNEEDIIGITGELAFEKLFKLPMDRSLYENGDDHVDFSYKYKDKNVTIDVKTARKAFNILIKEWEINKAADIIVLCQFDNFKIKFLGWESLKVMKTMPVKDFGYGIKNYYRNIKDCRSMDELYQFFIKNNIISDVNNKISV